MSMVSSIKLSLCMIVKDEAAHIAECIGSVQELVDEIIVVDTGSVDNTPEIARSMGAGVYAFPWKDDFAAARNESLKHATGAWILVLDADEVMDGKDHPEIRGLIQSNSASGYRLVQRSYQNRSTRSDWTALGAPTPYAKGYPGYIPSPLVRLFINNSDVRFKGRVHELVEHDLLAHGFQIDDTTIPIHHYGQIIGNERLQRKNELYRKIGEHKISENPSNARAFYELGLQYMEAKDPAKAEAALARAQMLAPGDCDTAFNYAAALGQNGKIVQATEAYRRTLDLDPTHSGALNNLALLLQENRGDSMEIDTLYQKALKINPYHHAVHYNYGLFLEKTGNTTHAVNHYRHALDIDPDFEPAKIRLQISSETQQPSMDFQSAGTETHMTDTDIISLGKALMEQENWVEALDTFSTVLLKVPDNADLRYTCGLILEKLNQPDAAFEQYEQILAEHPRHVDTLFRLAQESFRQELWADCITLCKTVLAENSQHMDARFKMACAFVNLGDDIAAKSEIEKILKSHRHHAPALELKDSIERKTAASRRSSFVHVADTKLKIAFLAGGIPFSGDTLSEKPLGGAETGLIHMAHSLSDLGHEVQVFSQQGQGCHNGVAYRELSTYLSELKRSPADVVIMARFFHPPHIALPARLRFFWTGDAPDQPYVAPLGDAVILKNIHRILTISQWQTDGFMTHFKIPANKFMITRNGVFWDNFETIPSNRNQKKLIYSSTPFRGLDVLLYLFPKIREKVPDAQLDIYSSMAVYGVDQKEDQKQFGHLYQFARQPGVRLLGNVIQSELAEALKGAGIFAYPNTFEETSCIAVMEAMAAGLPVVTSQRGALPETVAQGGIVIPGDPATDAYHSEFVDTVCCLLTDEDRWRRLGREARQWAQQKYKWKDIAKEWSIEFTKLLNVI